jgi:hypothetical protein
VDHQEQVVHQDQVDHQDQVALQVVQDQVAHQVLPVTMDQTVVDGNLQVLVRLLVLDLSKLIT